MLREPQRPIGVFDSGLGGLTVLKSLRNALPDESFVYLGDVARLPYGTKSREVVSRYALRCVEHLYRHEVKTVVVACNTATASALDHLGEVSPVPVFGVIAPGTRSAIEKSRTKKILVAATAATVKSEAYAKAFRSFDPRTHVKQLACPLLVPLAEEGWFDHEVTKTVIRSYVESVGDFSFDTILLGCTHYPLLAKSFAAVLGAGVNVVHGGPSLAEDLKAYLEATGLAAEPSNESRHRFLATDAVPAGSPILRELFGDNSQFEIVDL